MGRFLSGQYTGAAAQSEDKTSPDGIIKSVTQQVLNQIKNNKEIQAGKGPHY
jgi:hypothetical protein